MIPRHSAKETAYTMFASSSVYVSDIKSRMACCYFAVNEIINQLNHEDHKIYLKYHDYWSNVKNELQQIELEIEKL